MLVIFSLFLVRRQDDAGYAGSHSLSVRSGVFQALL